MQNINVYRIPLGSYECNCYIVHNLENDNALIIDCGDGEGLNRYLIENNLKLNIKYGLLTHGHFDHVMGVKYIQDNFNTVFFMALQDLQAQYQEPYLFSELENVNIVYDSTKLDLGDFKVQVISTPGHTMGSVSYKIDNLIFTGDTLFKGTIGRTDLYGGNFDDIIRSIREKLFILSNDTIVYPGHGEDSTIGEEKKSNRFLKDILGKEDLDE